MVKEFYITIQGRRGRGTIKQKEIQETQGGGKGRGSAGRDLRVDRCTAQRKCDWFVTEHYSWEESIPPPFLQNAGSESDASQVEI